MWPAVSNHLLGALAAFAVGWAIRLMDDALDQDLDLAVGKANWSWRLGPGTTAYALFALTLAVLLEPATSICLLAAAYAVGMLGDTRVLPSKLPSYLEGILLWGGAAWRFGLHTAWTALGIMLAVQLVDDLLDRSRDQWLTARNWTIRLGLIGTGLVTCTLLAVVYWLDAWLLLYATLTFTFFQLLERVVRR
ncbi:MAG: hypothetical protein GX060_05240 [Firmicutes bacterium]|nr:hypothetical protein [Bacillota bacterium]